ncbi:MAG: hypothetical protein AB1Z65_10220, partial [Candidatus Sulfomarinibacteraceae bacterium]
MMHLDRARSQGREAEWPRASGGDWAVLLVSAALAPVVVRVALLVEAAIIPVGADGRGVLADAAACLVFAGVLATLSRWSGSGR